MNFGAPSGQVTMIQVLLLAVVCGLKSGAVEPPASQWSRNEFQNLTLRQHRTCVENEQYYYQGLCCLNCQAGTFVHKGCDRDQERGLCLPCEHGQTYTEHSNGMHGCLPCTRCRTDEIETASCTKTSDTRCQCKLGTFCVPDQACEVCKRCAKCKAGEEEVEKCTPSSNTVCRKRDPSPVEPSQASPTLNPSPSLETVLFAVFGVVLFLVLLGLAAWRFRQRLSEIPCIRNQCHSSEIVKIPIPDKSGATAEEQQNDQNAGLEEFRPESRPLLQETQPGMTKHSPPLEDKDCGLGDSLPNTTNSSQTSLSGLPMTCATTPRPSPTAVRIAPADVDDPLRYILVPLLGPEKSLKMSFDLFDEYLDVQIHNKFFRMIGISDNHIHLAESCSPPDKVYKLLTTWMQKQGRRADINSLLNALLSMDQRRSAESVASAALLKGYYKHAETP